MADPARLDFDSVRSPVEDVIADARSGRMVILVDDEDRENEGDFVIPAQMATPDAVNFMATYGRGLVCLALTGQRARELDLPMMARRNEAALGTAFTVSIEARQGVTTGISAPDRAHTIATAVNPANGAEALVTPGHVFPLVARDGGVLQRIGHTEAAVDIARLAGLYPAGVICEVMNDDGTMARRDDLVAVAARHGIKIATIADLVAYRRRHDPIVRRERTGAFTSVFGGTFRAATYRNAGTGADHVALWQGDPAGPQPVPVHVRVSDVFDDMLGNTASGRAGELQAAMQWIGDAGRGVIVLVGSSPAATATVANRLDDPGAAPGTGEDHESPAQILFDLGVREIEAIGDLPPGASGMDEDGLRIAARHPINRSHHLIIREGSGPR